MVLREIMCKESRPALTFECTMASRAQLPCIVHRQRHVRVDNGVGLHVLHDKLHREADTMILIQAIPQDFRAQY